MEKWRGKLSVLIMFIALGTCLAISNTSYAQSQSATATLTGHISDPTGAVVNGANIELLDMETGTVRKSVGDSSGRYNLTNLSHGSYTLTIKMQGFSDVVISSIPLQVGQTANIDVTMQPGKVVQHVEVSASAVMLQTQTSELSAVLPVTAIRQLPTAARNPMEFLSLMPGVTASYVTGQGKGGSQNPGSNNSLSDSGRSAIEASGVGTASNLILLDGISINAQSTNGNATPKILPSTDATQEFSFITNNISPEYGRGVNVVNIITKRGTNSIHGSLYEFNQNTAFNANNYLNIARHLPRSVFNKNQFGGTFGGPVYIPHLYNGKDRTWFFVNLEQLRSVTGGTTLVTVPTAAERAGDFSGLVSTNGTPITIYDPLNTVVVGGVVQRQPFPGNIIPTGRISAFAANLMSFYPNPNIPGGQQTSGGLPTNINNFQESANNELRFTRILIRGDHQISNNQQLMLRFEEDPEYNPYNSVYGNISSPVASTLGRHTTFHNAEVSHTWTVSPTFVAQQSVGWVHERYFGPNFSPGFDPTSLGGPFTAGNIQSWASTYAGGSAFPHVTLGSGYGGFGQSGLSFYNGNNGNFVYNLNLTKERGRNELKWGFQYQFDPQDQVNGLGTNGDYNFNGQFTQGNNPLVPTANTGDSFADFLLGYPSGGGLSSNQRFTASSSYYAWYFLDNWRATRRLTLNLGLRYEFTNNFTDRFNEAGGIDPFIPNPLGNQIGPNTGGKTLNQFLGRTLYGGLVFAGTADVDGRRRLIPNDYSNLGPRAGFAYQLTNKLVLRGGASRIYAQSLSTAANSGAQGTSAFFITTPIVGTVDGINPAVTIDNPFPGGILVPPGASKGLLTGVGLPLSVGTIGPMVTPYVNEWNIGVQLAATEKSVLSVAYAGTYAKRLPCPSYCGDQLSQQQLTQYGSSLLSSVANPFYGIITDPTSALSKPTVQMGQLLKNFPQYPGGTLGSVPAIQGQNNWPVFDDTDQRYPFVSNWNALEASYQLHNFHSMDIMVAYTHSKHTTNANGVQGYALGSPGGFQNVHNPASEMAIAPTDVPDRLVITHVIDLPFGHGKHFAGGVGTGMDRIIGGWQLTGVVTLASGFPIPINQAPNNLNALIGAQRPNIVGTPKESSGSRAQRVSQWFADPTTTFAVAPAFTYGDAPLMLGSVRSDPLKNYDLSLIKITPINERVKAEFRASAFNLLNRPWFGLPNSTVGSSTFGLVSTLNGPPRGLELALKLNW
jgi:hypothetical protein